MTRYIKNEFGGVHSVDDETVDSDGLTPYDKLLVSTPGGQRLLQAGWSELTKAEAKKANPQLFGAADRNVRMNAKEAADAAALAPFSAPDTSNTEE